MRTKDELFSELGVTSGSDVEILRFVGGTGPTSELARIQSQDTQESNRKGRQARSKSVTMVVSVEEARVLSDAGATADPERRP